MWFYPHGVRSSGRGGGICPSADGATFCPPQVNGINLREASHDDAINVLRQTPQRVRLAVYRDEAQDKEEEPWDSFTLELRRRPGQGLGLSIVGRRWVGAALPSPRCLQNRSNRISVLANADVLGQR